VLGLSTEITPSTSLDHRPPEHQEATVERSAKGTQTNAEFRSIHGAGLDQSRLTKPGTLERSVATWFYHLVHARLASASAQKLVSAGVKGQQGSRPFCGEISNCGRGWQVPFMDSPRKKGLRSFLPGCLGRFLRSNIYMTAESADSSASDCLTYYCEMHVTLRHRAWSDASAWGQRLWECSETFGMCKR